MKKCPRCGFINNSGNRFCKRCGFNLSRYEQRTGGPNYGTAQQRPPFSAQPPYQAMNYGHQPPYLPQRHHVTAWLLSIIAVAVLAFAGIGAYSNNVWPFGNGPVGQMLGQGPQQSAKPHDNSASSNNSNNNASGFNHHHNSDNNTYPATVNYTPVKTFWGRINNKLNSQSSKGGNTNVDDLFQNSDRNDSLSGIKGWLSFVSKADQRNDTEVISIKPYDFNTNGNEIHYKVRYDFKLHAHSQNAFRHIQIFNWRAVIQNGEITSMKSPKKPAVDYKE